MEESRLERICTMFSFLSIKFYMMARSNANCSESASSLIFNSKVPLKLKWNKWIEVEVRFEISQVCKAYWKSSIVFMTGYCCTVGDYRRNKAAVLNFPA